MATTESRHASKPSISALEAARARIRKDEQSFEPRTPPHHRNRSMVSSFGSTSSALSSFRNEEDAIIIEMGARSLRAGFEGESMPMCTVGFGPEESRKAGDYRGWIKTKGGTPGETPRSLDAEEWARDHELWRMDLREVDLGLVEDKLERAVREIYNNYLLTDAGNARLVLVMPSVMPHPLLSVILETLFNRWRFPSITLLPSAAMVAAAAGVRAALVVDIGWAETTVTAIYEYRDITSKRSTRATKSLMQKMGRMLSQRDDTAKAEAENDSKVSVDFNYCEEVVSRFAWCKFAPEDENLNKNVSIPSPSNPDSGYVQLPFSQFAKPVEENFFANGVDEHELDDDERPIHILVYDALLELPPDVRGACMSRIIFVGGGSRIPGIRQRIVNEASSLVAEHGWDATRGRAVEEQRKKLQQLKISRESNNTSEDLQADTTDTAHEKSEEPEEPEELDFVEQKIHRNRARHSKPLIQGQFRQVESLGAWAGASLVTSLKIRGLVEVEREKFLRDGLASATRDLDGHRHHVADRRSGVRSSVISDRSSWTLAGWG
ncbi:actin-related protein RO7, putative [Talaromyces stipitatus ATCC 10500]|uniref:Actin-related protein RO7, putative n=1 Tax=Talaromyces stipitatus (strain ATCC 10500 / CBS 375.48 / QM 6759 / NRRL 1006) TaxID=441959 RepID=B8M6K4_TALSN|nr:actin-related protein RO7, putative [Talaromyces stipitatus ATCC 10500]EED19466.1 actin-related protein RO7, putative [Talaromyces stipitatus ATCC 10500]